MSYPHVPARELTKRIEGHEHQEIIYDIVAHRNDIEEFINTVQTSLAERSLSPDSTRLARSKPSSTARKPKLGKRSKKRSETISLG
jgi:hypothetical protein